MNHINIWGTKIPYFNCEIKNIENENCATISPFLLQDNDGKKAPTILIFEGGSYARHSYTCEEEALWLNSLGINCFIVNYRVFPYNFPIPLLDAKRAIRYIKYNASKFNIDPEKIGVMGFSAGGHLAGMVSLLFDKFDEQPKDEIDKVSAKPDLAIMSYPVVTLCKNFRHQNSVENLCGKNEKFFELLSLENNARKDIPKLMLWHTMEDTLVTPENSLSLANALYKKGANFEFHLIRKGEHGLKIFEDTKDAKKILFLIKQFLKDENYMK